MQLSQLVPPQVRFTTSDRIRANIESICRANADLATYCHLGESEQGRPIYGVLLGSGDRSVSLIAGAHSDEPVGPETLRILILEGLAQGSQLQPLLSKFRFVIVPHINPDGEARNQTWISEWPNLELYVEHAFREPPGRDLEFGFPKMRAENTVVAKLLQGYGPFVLHMSLHGMGFSDGAMLLLEKHWISRTGNLRQAFSAYVQKLGFALHDHDRKGEKGFDHIGPGYTTTPRGQAMRQHFLRLGDAATGNLFHDSSMEFVRTLGQDPLSVVTEMPLFLMKKNAALEKPGIPGTYLNFKRELSQWRLRRKSPLQELAAAFELRHIDLKTQVHLQLTALDLALQCVDEQHSAVKPN